MIYYYYVYVYLGRVIKLVPFNYIYIPVNTAGVTFYILRNVPNEVLNNPLSYAGPQEFYTGQTDETNQNTMQGQNIFY